MPPRFPIRITSVAIACGLVLALLSAWRADRRDRAQLAADLATGRQALAQADARQHDRDAQLLQTVAALAAEKRAITAPAQIVHALPQQIPLPVPLTLQPPNPPGQFNEGHPVAQAHALGPEGLDSAAPTNAKPSAKPAEASAVIPAADLKPLYDFSLDCRACQAKLATAQADLTDQRAKTAVLTRERDEAVRAAKGGSLLRRITRNAKWFVIGAAAAAIAAKAHP